MRLEVSRQSRPLKSVTSEDAGPDLSLSGHGKVILLGEHAVVYGRPAIAAPVPVAARATVLDSDTGEVEFFCPRWGVEYTLHKNPLKRSSFERPLGALLERFDLLDRSMRIEVFPKVPRAMGLGGSAAVAVAIARAISSHYQLNLKDDQINEIAYEFEKVAHSEPSGIDNTVATYGKLLKYNREAEPRFETMQCPKPIPLVIGISGIESLTARMVAQVRNGWKSNPKPYERVFDEIGRLTAEACDAIAAYDLPALGSLMNFCQGQLNALQVSSWELEEMIQIARSSGALGAKLTGAGGGGSIIALCPDNQAEVVSALQDSGYQAMEVEIGV